MSETKIQIPESVKSGGELIVSADTPIEYVHIYESPRQKFSKDDVNKKSPFWRADIYEISHDEDFIDSNHVKLRMRRGPDNRPAVYGRYLVKVKLTDGTKVEKFLIVEHVRVNV